MRASYHLLLGTLTPLQKACLISVILHLACFLILSFSPSLPLKSKNQPVPHRTVIVDFVKIGPKSAAPMLGPQTVEKSAQKKSEIKKEPAKPALLKAKASPQSQNKPDVTKSARDIKKPAAKPVKIPNQSKSIKKSVPDKQKSAKKTASKAISKPTPKASNSAHKAKVNLAKDQASSVNDFLKNKSPFKGAMAAADELGEELTGTDIDVLNQHMKRFWNLPSGHEKAYNISVEIELFIAKDGTITKAQVVDQNRLQRDNEFRIAAESALRAVLDPQCSPLPLDPNKYKAWKHMIFVFDPSEMCN